MTTLIDYWTADVLDLDTALSSTRASLATLRQSLAQAQTQHRLQSDVVRAAADTVSLARKALAGIPMPADGDPLLVQMNQALIAWRDAQAATARIDLAQQSLRAELALAEAREARLVSERAQAQAVLGRIEREALDRQKATLALTTGAWSTVSADAADVLAEFEATARARIEGEFPASATQSKDFLKRVRARRALVAASLAQADEVDADAFVAGEEALTQAQRKFEQAWQTVRSLTEAASRLVDDRAVLARLAALPAATPPTRFPVLTPAQHRLLFEPTLKAAREAALVKLKAADDAELAVRTAQASYDKALHAAMKLNPLKTRSELDATAVAAELTTLTGKLDDLKAARKAIEVDDAEGYKVLQSWFAAVPDTLWSALEQLDTALEHLSLLKGPPVASTLLADLAAREADLVTALSAARVSQRMQAAAREARQRAAALLQAEQGTAAARAQAASRGTASL